MKKVNLVIILICSLIATHSFADPFDAFKDIADGIDKAIQGDDKKEKKKKDKKNSDAVTQESAANSTGNNCGDLSYMLQPQYKNQSSSSMVEVFDRITNEFKYEKPEDVVSNLTKKDYRCKNWKVCYDTFNNEYNLMPTLYKFYVNSKNNDCPGNLTQDELASLKSLNKGKWSRMFDSLRVYINDYKTIEDNKIAQQDKKNFQNSPEGQKKKLSDAYFAYMVIKFAHDVRKDYQLKYVTTPVLNDVKKSMKTIENDVKKNVPDIDTDALWNSASKEYVKEYGQVEDMHKADPQLYVEDFHNLVKMMITAFNQESRKLSGGEKSQPKKDF